MALTLEKLRALENAELTDLFDKNLKVWSEMAEEAFEYTAGFVAPTGQPVRPDDVLPTLVPVLKVNDKLQKHLQGRKLRQQYWYTYFGELVIDRLWDRLKKPT